MSRKLYVGNIPFETNENDLQQLFAEAGAVESVNVVRDRETGRARGFAFVEMATDEAAQAAVSQLHDRSFGGRRLTVNEARPQTPRSGGGGGGYGRGGGGGLCKDVAGQGVEKRGALRPGGGALPRAEGTYGCRQGGDCPHHQSRRS